MDPGCEGVLLTACGLYHTIRKVLDVDGYFKVETEYLECGRCHKKYASWSFVILDAGYCSQFPAVLAYPYSCSKRVMRLLREWALGNSTSQIIKKLMQQHAEEWLERRAVYLSVCEQFISFPLTRNTMKPPP